ncbi:NAD-dependent protein deacylase [Paenibacillus antri]|uniref:NAD-dependent protein deacetylase n=1 Tax=Paenibacillus antri TaxID=2582848 RepID=A0A5R9G770_9BACL|nr:NAD-dependent protein deacylase [Paenibacillus antri]TLS50226.1 NAD-dependent protein deacylase [Paenibacillus antri]
MDNGTELEKVKRWIADSERVVFFGGAGTSTESGIPDFRSAAGLYNAAQGKGVPPEVMLSHTYFMEQTESFFEFYKSRMIYKEAVPNAAHRALASLERAGKLKAVVTQNIDGLHQAAGSRTVFELHGSVRRNRCMDCDAFYDLEDMLALGGVVPRCSACGGVVKPNVVLYEEPLDQATWARALEAIREADLLIVGGTSLTVYPAAGLVDEFRGARLVLINRDETGYDTRAGAIFRGSIGETLGELTSAT